MDEISSFRGDYFFLSNFYPVEFAVEGLGSVRSSEQAYMAFKAVYEDDRLAVLRAMTPAEAKEIAGSVALTPGWDAGGRVNAMLTAVSAKFAVPDLRRRLIETGTAPLTEGNTHHDNYWGDCVCGRSECLLPGKNMLGELLMALRSGLRQST
ncbi:MAG: NADAR family protein [Gordonia sp. (in: high G+C Gram-positive bacteria)]|uniref:NADAR family protein n=1 Tax=Gordonia sp. (in: high G+C Gram-positive bacteria) TaxID=84139 RepID=UPI0039E4A6DE